jgi:hypothetical protein
VPGVFFFWGETGVGCFRKKNKTNVHPIVLVETSPEYTLRMTHKLDLLKKYYGE